MTAVKDDGERLIMFLNSLCPLNENVIEKAKANALQILLKKNEVLTYPDNGKKDCIFIILKGVVRGFIIDDSKDITTVITSENQLMGYVRNAAITESVYEEQFQALEDSELLVLNYAFIDELYLQYPEINILARKLLALHFNQSNERAILSRIPSAEARYTQFKSGHPALKNRVPIKFLATYLGMRIETLSRIRKKEKLGLVN